MANEYIWENFQRRYAECKPYEEAGLEKSLAYFNSSNPTKPYSITQVQDKANHNSMLYDGKLSNGEEEIKIEVKTDMKSKVTGNFFIEYSQYGKKSGISTTQADYWVINDTENYWLIPVSIIVRTLRELYVNKALKTAQNVTHGYVTKGYIIKKSILLGLPSTVKLE